MFIRRYSYKAGILLGLSLYAAGTMLFFPAGNAASYPFFLFAIYVMAGCAVLETTANPYVISMGRKTLPHGASTWRRRSTPWELWREFSSAGISSSLNCRRQERPKRAGMSTDALNALQHRELDAISGTYMLIGVILLALLATIAFIKMRAKKITPPS